MNKYYLLAVLFFSICFSLTGQEAVKDLPEGWEHEVLYQSDFITPHSLCFDDKDKLYILDIVLKKICIMDSIDEISLYAQIDNKNITLIGYQTPQQRLIGFSGFDLYYFENGNFQYQKSLNNEITTIVINPENGYFYSGSLFNHKSIDYYDSEGNHIETIIEDAQGCSQIALDYNHQKLYYCETFTGKLYEYDLTTKNTSTLVTGLGIPDTDEAIAVGLDGENNLYFFTACLPGSEYNGLNLYKNGEVTQLIPAISGMGKMYWHPKKKVFVNTSSAGGNLVVYDPGSQEAYELFHSVNTPLIAEMGNDIVVGISNRLYKVIDKELVSMGDSFQNGLVSITSDKEGVLYASLHDHNQIIRIHEDGSYDVLLERFTNGMMGFLYYDWKNHSLIVFIDMESKLQIWRIDISKNPEAVMIYEDTELLNSHGTIDREGNIYFYDYDTNSIYKIHGEDYSREKIFHNVVQSAVVGNPPILYSIKAEGIIVGQNDDFMLVPMNGEEAFLFAVNSVGVDNIGLYQGRDSSIICTHTGQIFKIYQEENETKIDLRTDLNEYSCKLYQNYPNPIGEETTIKYKISGNQKVQLVIYNSLGQRIKTMVHQFQNSGMYEIKMDKDLFTSGIYYLQLKTGKYSETKKMMVIK